MISRNFYFQLIFRVIFLSFTALVSAFLLFDHRYILTFLAFILLVVQVVFLIKYLNHTNRKIAYFFDAIRNEDFTLRFPEKDLIKSFKNLNQSLNRVNELIQDVHLRKQAQEHYYQEILKQANIGILTINEKGHILFANPTVEKLLNYKPLNHIKQLAQVNEELYSLFEGLKPFDRKLYQLTNEREKTQLAIKSTAITVDGQNLLLVVIQDIHMELDQKETDSWIKLIRVLTHEIMNTITPMTSISESILKYYKTENGLVAIEDFAEKHIENTAKGLEVIRAQGSDLMSFVRSYRSFLNVPTPDREIVSAQKLLDRLKVLVDQDAHSDNITFSMSIYPENLELFVDEKQIIQVLTNLSKNALQSLKSVHNGTIKISAGINREGKKYIEVKDNGPGIQPELIDEIFVPFFTTKKAGTGIGLSLSKQIMRLHGGTIKVRSSLNNETAFTVVL